MNDNSSEDELREQSNQDDENEYNLGNDVSQGAQTGQDAYRWAKRGYKTNKLIARQGKKVFSKTGRRAGIQASRIGSRLAIQGGRAAAQGVVRIGAVALASPEVLIILAIILAVVILVIIIILLIGGASSGKALEGGPDSGEAPIEAPAPTDPQLQISGLIITLTGPSFVNNGEDILYSVTLQIDEAQLPGPVETIILTDPIPSGATFVDATGSFVFDSTSNTATWKLSDAINKAGFTITLHPTTADTNITNQIFATIEASPPISGSDCGGKYTASTPIGVNYADTGCDFTEGQLYTILKSADPANADKWYFEIVPCESGYNPNSYNPLAVDSAGAWGLFQMGRGLNGIYDHGDVAWRTQITNAVTYNKDRLGGSFAYWACAS